MDRFWKVSFELPADLEEPLAAWLQASGALGAELRPAPGGGLEVIAWFRDGEGDPAAALAAASGRADLRPRVEPGEDGGWAERFQRSLAPFPLGAGFQVVPTEAPAGAGAPGRIPIHLPPGRAFGTGDHPTTALCLEYLEREVSPGMHLLDVGTGSGILAIAAARLGAARVVAVEPDREAAAVALANFRRNGVARRVELVAGGLAEVRGSWFDRLAANLLARALVELMPEIALRLRPDGGAVLSGMTAEEWEAVADAAQARGLRPVEVRERAGWVALEVRRRGPPLPC